MKKAFEHIFIVFLVLGVSLIMINHYFYSTYTDVYTWVKNPHRFTSDQDGIVIRLNNFRYIFDRKDGNPKLFIIDNNRLFLLSASDSEGGPYTYHFWSRQDLQSLTKEYPNTLPYLDSSLPCFGVARAGETYQEDSQYKTERQKELEKDYDKQLATTAFPCNQSVQEKRFKCRIVNPWNVHFAPFNIFSQRPLRCRGQNFFFK